MHKFRLINVRNENNQTISFHYSTKDFRSHWDVDADCIAPKITIAGTMENENRMGSGATSEYLANSFDDIHRSMNSKKNIDIQFSKVCEKAESLFKVDQEIEEITNFTDEE
ncbi:hypothetical protein TNIN_233411 [Trichonephila inaurata madagascariensis]|uniref:Uncharacterized protein n=1 Tax=Trichonephila inaurata madagascariensis TaxID=2747483 RepID=A0A8X7CL40_9ARAC|nr:hypothetical protein TNIN_233411 [Trichonephila inaurata madagascariensis]